MVNPFNYGVQPAPPKTNAERQAEFRKRHPNYHRRYYKTAAQWKAELQANKLREALEREQNDPQLLLFPGERPAMQEAA